MILLKSLLQSWNMNMFYNKRDVSSLPPWHQLCIVFIFIIFGQIQPPAFPKETPETIKSYIEETYLQLRLDPDEFSPEKAGRQWDFDWFEMAKVSLDPSPPRSVVVPTWVLPFVRPKKDGTAGGAWEPGSVQVLIVQSTVSAIFTHDRLSNLTNFTF